MIYNTEQVYIHGMYLYIHIIYYRVVLIFVMKFWYAAKVIQFLHGYLVRVSHYILYVYQFSILTWDGQDDDIIRLLSSQSDDWSQASPTKDRFYQFHSDFRILFMMPKSQDFSLFQFEAWDGPRTEDLESLTNTAWDVMKLSCCQPPAPASQSYHGETSLHLHTMRTSY